MKVVETDDDLPYFLNSPQKQKRRAKQVAEDFASEKAVDARLVNIQGFFSRTLIVSMVSGKELIVQFRVEPIDISDFQIARRHLGDVVPEITAVSHPTFEKHDVYPYVMSLVPGITWDEAPDAAKTHVHTLSSLGNVFSKGFVSSDSSQVVDNEVLPALKKIHASSDARIDPFRTQILEFIDRAQDLKVLPLFIAHADLNQMNILVDEQANVSGIVDWEGASIRPFGMGFCRLHTLAGDIINGNFHMPPTFEAAEKGFWDAVISGLPEHVNSVLLDNLEVVQMGLRMATLLENLDSEHGFNARLLKALPKLLSYKMPHLRAKGEPPYCEES